MGEPEIPHQSIRTSYFNAAGLLVALTLFVLLIAYGVVLSYKAHAGEPASIGTQVVAQMLLAYALMFLVWWRMPNDPDQRIVSMLFVSAILCRVLLIFIEPYTSSDVSRYLFDGRIALEGLDPYRVAHDQPQLAELRAQWQPPPEHAKYTTLYPPLALALYSFAASFGTTLALLVWKCLTTLASVAICFIAYKSLQKAKLLQHFPLIALSPILILEAGEAAHVDVFSALCVLISIYAWQHQRLGLAGLAIGIGVTIKLLPLMMLLPLWFACRSWRSRVNLMLGCAISTTVVYASALALGLRPIGSISTFFSKWRASSPLFHWLEPNLGTALPYVAVVIGGCTILLIALYAWRIKQLSFSSLALIAQASLAVPLLISPVVFPWYLMPVAVLFAFRPNSFIALWMITFVFTYEVLNDFLCCGIWAPSAWAINLIGAGFVIGGVGAFKYDLRQK